MEFELKELISGLRDKHNPKSQKIQLIKSTSRYHPWIKEVFKYTYDPFVQFYIKSRFPIMKAEDQSDHLSFDGFFWEEELKPLLDLLTKRSLDVKGSTDAILEKLQMLDTDEERELVKNIILKDLRIGFAAKSLNSAIGEDLIPSSDCQLCKTWDPSKTIKNVNEWYASRKLNGLRGRYKERDGSYVFLTREDYPLVGFDEIVGELKIIQEKYDLSLIDGEIFTMGLPFQYIMSIARGEKNFDPEKKKLLRFNIFNVQINGKNHLSTPDMIDLLDRIFQENPSLQYVTELSYERIPNDPKIILKKCRDYTDEGYEGIVLRDPIISFEGGKRNNHLLKFKLFNETDLMITDILYGEAGKKWEHSVVALKCQGSVRAIHLDGTDTFMPVPDDVEQSLEIPVIVEATCSSCTDKEREDLTLLAKDHPDQIIGRIAEVKFQAITDKPNEQGFYSLQFPVFLKFKSF